MTWHGVMNNVAPSAIFLFFPDAFVICLCSEAVSCSLMCVKWKQCSWRQYDASDHYCEALISLPAVAARFTKENYSFLALFFIIIS